jgi:Tfp pilus assembly protein PilZ
MKSPLAATTFSSLDLKGMQAILVAYMGMLLKTSMMVVIMDCFFLSEDLLIPLLDTPHFK